MPTIHKDNQNIKVRTKEFKPLNTGSVCTNVKLISYSTPSAEMLDKGLLDAQDLIAFCARVSNPNNQFNKETNAKLIKYLIKYKHWSPLEMVSATLEIETTRDIARQRPNKRFNLYAT